MKTLITVVILGFATMLHAQHNLSGIVTDVNNLPLAGVSVYVQEINKGTVTDDAGKFSLKSLPARNLTVSLAYIGYVTQNRKIQVINETTLNIVLQQAVHQMDEVIVSTAFNKLQSENVMKVDHVTVETFRQKGVTSLMEGIATIPGVSNISTGTSIGKPVIRGLSSNRVLVYSQGVRLENQQFGDEHGLGLSESGIESVEVIKGPASLLYGSDALGGVLYFNPEKFAEANTITGNVSQKYYSNTLGSNFSAGIKGSTANWKFLARGGYNVHSDYKIADGNRITNTRYNESDLKGGIGYSTTNYSGTVRYNFNRLDIGIPEEGIAEQSKSGRTIFPKQAIDNHIVSFHNDIILKNWKLTANLGYVYNDRSEFEEAGAPTLHMKLSTASYDFKLHLPNMGRFETIAGFQGMFQQNANFGSEFLIPDAKITDFGVFATTTYEWANSALQAGIRYDNRKLETEQHGQLDENIFDPVNRSFDSFNQSIGYRTLYDDKLTLRVNLASGFRAPNLAELTSNGVHEGTNRYEIGNSRLDTEQNYQLDINIDYKASHFEFFANGFYNHINNYIYAAQNGEVIDDTNVFAYVQNDAALFGGEAGIHLHPHPFDWLHLESSF
ncbi:MAG TPA: TonB-dependent receptor, partial [Flavobacterium sp.]|nr:TonB-dependent receptor [Flavobacterium sp.]